MNVQFSLSTTLRRVAILVSFVIGAFFSIRAFTDRALATTTGQASDTHVPIEKIQLGQRVVGRNPLREQIQTAAIVDRTQWRRIDLVTDQGGVRYDLSFLRPIVWLEQQGAVEGGTFHLVMREIGLDGPAQVIRISECPPIESDDRTGRSVVTGTMSHPAKNLLMVSFEGQPELLGVTTTHPMWSEDRRSFVTAGQLKVGERLRRVDGHVSKVARVTPHTGPPVMVYNLEVDSEHVYCVGVDGLLVHNNCLPDKTLDSRNAALREAKRDLQIPQTQHPDSVTRVPMTNRDGSRVLGPDGRPVMTREYRYTTPDGRTVVIQDHSAGHPQFGIGPHMNVRPVDDLGNTIRNGEVPGTSGHYGF